MSDLENAVWQALTGSAEEWAGCADREVVERITEAIQPFLSRAATAGYREGKHDIDSLSAFSRPGIARAIENAFWELYPQREGSPFNWEGIAQRVQGTRPDRGLSEVQQLAAALYGLEWQADLYDGPAATSAPPVQVKYEGRAVRLLASAWMAKYH